MEPDRSNCQAPAGQPDTALAGAVFIDGGGALRGTRPGADNPPASGSGLCGTPASVVAPNGDLIAVARDVYGAIWLNRLLYATGEWADWVALGGNFAGDPALALTTGGDALVAARDHRNTYWVTRWPAAGGEWTEIAGVFGSDPALAPDREGGAFLAGRDSWSGLWVLHCTPAGFGALRSLGGIVQGRPAVTVGDDGVAYVVTRDHDGELWLAGADATGLVGWRRAGGMTTEDPSVARLGGGMLRLVLREVGGSVSVRDFPEGAGEAATEWQSAGGMLREVAIVVAGGHCFVTGRDVHGAVWWRMLPAGRWLRVKTSATATSAVR
jgi:hypothetical protein